MLDRLVGLIDPRVDLAILACAVCRRIFDFIELKIDFPVFGIDTAPPTDDNLVGLFIISDESTDIVSGVLDNTVFNIEDMTPHRLLLKHGNYLKSLLIYL